LWPVDGGFRRLDILNRLHEAVLPNLFFAHRDDFETSLNNQKPVVQVAIRMTLTKS
jgi:hypothetical protein